MKIVQLQTNHMTDPIGYTMDYLTFSWKTVETEAVSQVWARVEVAEDPAFETMIHDSGKDAAISSIAYCPKLVLEAEKRYYWRVSAASDLGEEAMSETAFFETPIASFEKGEWIRPSLPDTVHPYLRREFTAEKAENARLSITGLGLYEVYLNGVRIGEENLTPYCNDYYNFIQFQTYDVSDLLNEGKNTLGVMLGNGWYKGRFGFKGESGLFGNEYGLLCELRADTAEGRQTLAASDDAWLCAPSPVLESSIYDGEVYDARKEIAGWNENDLCTEGWDPVCYSEMLKKELVIARYSLPVADQEVLSMPKVIRTPKDELVFDFEQEITGTFEIDVDLPAGEKLFLQCGEILQQDCFYNDNLRSAKEEYTYISDGKKRTIRPHFTFYGFRYLKAENLSDPSCIRAIVQHTDLQNTGRLETSNPKLNRLFANAFWGQKGNFVDVPTDCPQRDERMGWTGDAEIFCRTASYNMNTPAFYHKYLYDMLLEQKKLNGAVPHVVPDFLYRGNDDEQVGNLTRTESGQTLHLIRNSEGSFNGACAWADAACVIPWTLYEMYGDPALLEKTYPNMQEWTGYLFDLDEKTGSTRSWHTGYHFADWLALDNYDHDSRIGATDIYYLATAYYYLSVSLTAKAARVLGKTADADHYETLASEIREAFQKEYFTSTGRLAIPTQTASVVALAFDLTPDAFVERTINTLKDKITAAGGQLTTGFIGTPYLCPTLSRFGALSMAYDLLLREEYPSWLYEVNMGATTIWERWNSVLPDGSISDTGMNSLNHYAYGSIAEWMYGVMCGLRPAAPGFAKAFIAPMPDRRLDFARACVDTAAGLYGCEWRYENDLLRISIQVPFNAEAEVTLPDGQTFTVKAGSYHYSIKA